MLLRVSSMYKGAHCHCQWLYCQGSWGSAVVHTGFGWGNTNCCIGGCTNHIGKVLPFWDYQNWKQGLWHCSRLQAWCVTRKVTSHYFSRGKKVVGNYWMSRGGNLLRPGLEKHTWREESLLEAQSLKTIWMRRKEYLWVWNMWRCAEVNEHIEGFKVKYWGRKDKNDPRACRAHPH